MLQHEPPPPQSPSDYYNQPTDSPSPPSHQPSNVYTAGLPAPPRILIPPPSLVPNDPEWQQPSLQSMVLQSESVLPGGLQDWKYEYRREAQQLLPHLWLGPLSATKDMGFLQRHGITLLLAVRSSKAAARVRPQVPGVVYQSIDVSSNHELIAQFQWASEIIDRHFLSTLSTAPPPEWGGVPLDGRALRGDEGGGKTLLFCESGNERSAAVAASYIMQHLSGTTVQAIQMVQAKRFCVCFDDSMKWMLMSYEPLWQARKQSRLFQNGGAGEGGNGGGSGDGCGGGDSGRKQKRGVDELDEDDEGADWTGGGRAPFLDEPTDVEMA